MQTDSILAIFVLYAASLPACYLMKKGVPALNQTEKLAEHKYVFQRIYETGLMLDGVLHPGGLRVIEDHAPFRVVTEGPRPAEAEHGQQKNLVAAGLSGCSIEPVPDGQIGDSRREGRYACTSLSVWPTSDGIADGDCAVRRRRGTGTF